MARHERHEGPKGTDGDDAWTREVEERPHAHHAEHDAQLTEATDVAADAGHAGHAGHGAHDGHDAHDKHAGHSPEMFRDRFWLSLVLTVPVLYFSEAFQAWFGYEAVAFPGSAWIAPVLATVLFFYGGGPFLAGARHELAARQPGMMMLISLAITVAYVYSLAVVLGLRGEPFFWELATLIDVMLLGHWIEMASVRSASKALEHLASLMPDTAHRLVGAGDETEDVPTGALRHGDRVLVRPGEQVPADGRVLEGRSSLNEAFLTGESRPVPKAEGDEVVAGAVNAEGALVVRVERTGDETTLSQVQRLVEEAQASRGRFQGLADRAAGWLFALATVAGTLTLIGWLLTEQDTQFAIARAVTVLVIACPHALGLAIPLVTVNATAVAARHGLLIRNREAFERARELRFVAFDKTGTLTEGAFELRATSAPELGEAEALRLALALERRSEHPLAQAVVAAAEAAGAQPPPVADFEVVAGKGVAGTVEGRRLRVGRPEWLAEHGVEPGPLAPALAAADARGDSAIVLFDEGRPLALFALADRVRPRARRAVEALRAMGVEPVMITGDAEAVARTVAAELGIDRWHARTLPQDKAEIVRALRREGRVAFVGDGINDAPALLAADLGIAVGAGTDVAIESADVVLAEDDPLDVVAGLQLSRATYAKMIQNLVWATGYNVLTLPLAAGVLASVGVLLSPAVGALMMSLSTVIVAINAMLLRRRRFGQEEAPAAA